MNSMTIDQALEVTVERLATEQDKPVPVLERDDEGYIHLGSVGAVARAFGMKPSELIAMAEAVQ